MTWEIHYNVKDNLIDIRTWGNVTIGQIDHSKHEIEHLREKKIIESVLIDAIDVESLPTKTTIIGFVASLFDSVTLSKTKFAILTCKERWNYFQYFEKFGVEGGLNVKAFLNRQMAMEWLTE